VTVLESSKAQFSSVMVKPNDVIAIILIVIFVGVTIVGYGIYRLVSVARRGTFSRSDSGSLVDDEVYVAPVPPVQAPPPPQRGEVFRARPDRVHAGVRGPLPAIILNQVQHVHHRDQAIPRRNRNIGIGPGGGRVGVGRGAAGPGRGRERSRVVDLAAGGIVDMDTDTDTP
jgi:hypothetical protein